MKVLKRAESGWRWVSVKEGREGSGEEEDDGDEELVLVGSSVGGGGV